MMAKPTERELRFLERERRQIQEEQRKTLSELQRQREAIIQLRSERRANPSELLVCETEPSPVPMQRQNRRTQLDYAGRLPTSDDTLDTLDEVVSPYTDEPCIIRDRQSLDSQTNIDIDRAFRSNRIETDRDRQTEVEQLRDGQTEVEQLRDRQPRDTLSTDSQNEMDRNIQLRDSQKEMTIYREFRDSNMGMDRDSQFTDSHEEVDTYRQFRDSLVNMNSVERLKDAQTHEARQTRDEPMSERFDVLLTRLSADIDLRQTDPELRSKSLPDRQTLDLPERQKLANKTSKMSQSEIGSQQLRHTTHKPLVYSAQGFEHSPSQDLIDERWQLDTRYEREEKELIARLNDLAFQERRLKEERQRRLNAEKDLERKLKALQLQNEEIRKESERKERIKALKLQAEKMQARLLEQEEADRNCEDRMERLVKETQKLERYITQTERGDRRPEQVLYAEGNETHMRQRQKRQEAMLTDAERQCSLEDELKRREALIKKEMEDERKTEWIKEDKVRYRGTESVTTEDHLHQEQLMSVLRQKEDMQRHQQRAYINQADYRNSRYDVKGKLDRQREIEAEARFKADIAESQRDETIYKQEEELRRQFENELSRKEAELEKREELIQQMKRERELARQNDQTVAKLWKRKEELERRERCLQQLEDELSKDDGKPTISTVQGDKTASKVDVTHFLKPFLTQFSGAEPTPKNESCFEDWKAEVQCLIKSDVYPDYIITQAVRNALKGQARKALTTLDPQTNSEGILNKLQSLFGNVASGLSILQEFYTSAQKEGENVTMWGLRIEEILQRAIEKGEVAPDRRNHLLKDKFWRSLRSLDLKIATKVYFDRVSDFEVLRAKVREEERELLTHKISLEQTAPSLATSTIHSSAAGTPVNIQHQPIHLDSGAAKFYADLSKRLERIEKLCSYRRRRNRYQNQINKDSNKQNIQQEQQREQQEGRQQQRQQAPEQVQQGQQEQDKTNNEINNLNRDRPPL